MGDNQVIAAGIHLHAGSILEGAIVEHDGAIPRGHLHSELVLLCRIGRDRINAQEHSYAIREGPAHQSHNSLPRKIPFDMWALIDGGVLERAPSTCSSTVRLGQNWLGSVLASYAVRVSARHHTPHAQPRQFRESLFFL